VWFLSFEELTAIRPFGMTSTILLARNRISAKDISCEKVKHESIPVANGLHGNRIARANSGMMLDHGSERPTVELRLHEKRLLNALDRN
jgi:hypothetical protein